MRDRCTLLVGFGAALRRSELAALRVDDVTVTDPGLQVAVRQSMTDQTGQGALLGVPYARNTDMCAVAAWRAWMAASATHDLRGRPLLLQINRHDQVLASGVSGGAVAEIVKRGPEPGAVLGHSMRAGLITAAAQALVAERDIARQSRHRSRATLSGYVRDATVFERNAAGAVL